MTVSHATITGSENHEPKGVESAGLGFIYVANGSGSGTWRILSYTDYPAGPHVIIEDQKTSGVDGQTVTANTDTQLNLTTLVYNHATLAALASNQFVLPAGTYYFRFSAPTYNVANAKVWLRNVTDSTDAIIGTTNNDGARGAYAITLQHSGSGILTIAASKTFELRVRTDGTQPLSTGYNDGRIQVYSHIEITKLA